MVTGTPACAAARRAQKLDLSRYEWTMAGFSASRISFSRWNAATFIFRTPSAYSGCPGGQRASKKMSSAWYTHSTGWNRAGSRLMSARICPSGPPCWRLGMK